jgi:predicted Zn-dependent protease
MRAHEFLTENAHEKAARDALITLLTTNHALGIKTIAVTQLTKSLEDRNFFVDADWIVDQIQDIPVVNASASNFKKIVMQLTRTDTDDQPEQAEPEASTFDDKVEKMAKRAVNSRRG